MTPKEHIDWFYEKFKDGLEGHHSPQIIERERKDQQVILTLIDEYDCKSVLEIGTWEGQTGLIIWLYPKIKKFRAIDINKDMDVKYNSNVHKLSDKEFIGHYLKDTNTKIDFIDTMKWDVEEWKKEAGEFDLIFIDGNHDTKHVENDTLKALKLKPKVIVWHDINHIDINDQVPIFLKYFMEDNPQYKLKYVLGTEIGYLVL